MPLPPLPESNTARLFVHYTHENVEHEVQVRPITSTNIPALANWFQNWLTENSGLFGTGTQFDSAQFAAQNSNIRNPIAWSPVTGTGTATSDPARFSRTASFVGRGSDGRKVRLFFYGTIFGPDNTYRVLSGESAVLDAAITDLNNLASKPGTITGAAPVWKPYANIRNNGYWQTRLRRNS